jgi:CRISP-associated protein Cas1
MPAADRVRDFSYSPAYLSVKNEQLVIDAKEFPAVSVPLNEIAVVLLNGPALTLTQTVLAKLLAVNATVVIGGENHLPAGMLLPISSNTLSTQRLFQQIQMTEPRKKRLWQSVVVAKILSQAVCLHDHGIDPQPIRLLADQVRSGDPDNLEATAAQRYWPLLFGPDFRRRFDAGDCNGLLNYGYAVLRAFVARSVCAAGLHPALGIFHRSRGNPFCLVDDLMEPYRPLVDSTVKSITQDWGIDVALSPKIKKQLVECVQQRVRHEKESRVLAEWIDKTAQSVLRSPDAPEASVEAPVFYPSGMLKAGRP